MSQPAAKLDRRVLRTRKVLWEALQTLIEEKDYADITIQEIADRANVNRVTFYLHYKDKQDLLEKSVEVVFEELTSAIAPYALENFRDDQPPADLTGVYRHLAKNARFYRIVLGENGIPFLVARFRKLLTDLAFKRLQFAAQESRAGRIPVEVAAQYASGALIGLVSWWLENNQPITAEELAQQTLLLTAYGVYWGIGLEAPKPGSGKGKGTMKKG